MGNRTGHGLKFSARAGPGFLTLSPGRAGLSPRALPAGQARGLKTGYSLAGQKVSRFSSINNGDELTTHNN